MARMVALSAAVTCREGADMTGMRSMYHLSQCARAYASIRLSVCLRIVPRTLMQA